MTGTQRGAFTSFFYDMFLPDNYPRSVAREYGPYQFWDTIQQVTYFVNTVISGVAIMKFHGVGDPTKTPEEATALSMGRDFLATIFALAASTPFFKSKYVNHAGFCRALSGFFIAAGHFLEVLAGTFSDALALLYMGPIVCNLGNAAAGPTRQVILQYFVDGGKPAANYGDVNLKETNQDSGGKVFGLTIGFILLTFVIGMNSDDPKQEDISLARSMKLFALLSIVHVYCNVLAVKQLKLKHSSGNDTPADQPQRSISSTGLKRMFIPNLDYLAPSYVKYRCFEGFGTLISSPKSVVVQIVQWHYMYGVGQTNKTPAQAYEIDMFTQAVSVAVGLMSGFPSLRKFFNNYMDVRWKLVSGVLGLVADLIFFGAAFLGGEPQKFYPLIIVSRTIGAFANTCGSYVNGNIMPCQILKEHKHNIKLVDVAMANGNQGKVVKLSSQVLCVAFLYNMVWSGYTPSFDQLLLMYGIFQLLQFIVVFGTFFYMPDISSTLKSERAVPLLAVEADLGDSEPDAIRRANSMPTSRWFSGSACQDDSFNASVGVVGPPGLMRSISC